MRFVNTNSNESKKPAGWSVTYLCLSQNISNRLSTLLIRWNTLTVVFKSSQIIKLEMFIEKYSSQFVLVFLFYMVRASCARNVFRD